MYGYGYPNYFAPGQPMPGQLEQLRIGQQAAQMQPMQPEPLQYATATHRPLQLFAPLENGASTLLSATYRASDFRFAMEALLSVSWHAARTMYANCREELWDKA